jgi:hypothetical protein
MDNLARAAAMYHKSGVKGKVSYLKVLIFLEHINKGSGKAILCIKKIKRLFGLVVLRVPVRQ